MTKREVHTKWQDANAEIASLLFELYRKHGEESASEVFNLLDTEEYKYANNWFGVAVHNFGTKSIDPIQIFAAFNHSSSSDSSRIFKINTLLKILGSKSSAQDSGHFFSGCPTMMISRVINSREVKFQQQIWNFFGQVMQHGKEGVTDDHIYQMGFWYGINWSAFTIFLFWINPDNFLPLDTNTRTFLVASGVIEKVPYDYKGNMDLCRIDNTPGLFSDIVYAAYQTIHKKKSEFIIQAESLEFLNSFRKQEEREEKLEALLGNFKLLAIRPTKEKQKHIKNIIPSLFKFYDSFIFKNDDRVISLNNDIDDLFNSENHTVSISAIVGKNGSGKSTLTELYYLALNKISGLVVSDDKVHEEEIFLDIFFKTDTIYKLSVGDQTTLHAYKYSAKSKQYNFIEENIIDPFKHNNFFYTVGINYSLYGLNSKTIGRWIDALFHKNDSYQIPIVLNPKRVEGNIDVNAEESLGRSRLLASILEWDRIDLEKNEPKELVEGKIPFNLEVRFDHKKYDRILKRNRTNKIDHEEVRNRTDVIFRFIKKTTITVPYENEIREYIYDKMISVATTYDQYKKFISYDQETGKIVWDAYEKYVKELIKDKSHVTFKLRQAINYLLFNKLNFDKDNSEHNVIELAQGIEHVKQKEFESNSISLEEMPTIWFIPPSLFKTEIIFKGGGKFKDLSSGEKQMIISINTVAYHTFNINSVRASDMIQQYNYINILFDEVELYFHPDMQRTYIHNLLSYLEHTPLANILGLNILFVTHSPFILSDIPSSNILRLKKGKPDDTEHNQTFGANIHDLLANDFFLENGFMGEFAKLKIEETIAFLNFRLLTEQLKRLNKELEQLDDDAQERDILNQEIEEIEQHLSGLEVTNNDMNYHQSIIETIGEPVLKNKLLDMFFSIQDEQTKKEKLEETFRKMAENAGVDIGSINLNP